MSIAEQIMLGTQQQSKNWSALSNSLGQLGQQIGDNLAMREYQRQYQAALPVIQQTMQAATQKIQAGDFTGGYAEAVGGLPLMSQNPLIAQASKSYLDSIKGVAEFQQSAMWQKLQQSRMGGGGVSGGGTNTGPVVDAGRFFPGMNVSFNAGAGDAQGAETGVGMGGVGEGADANQPDYSANPTTEPTDANTIEVIDDSGQALFYPPRGLEGGLPSNDQAATPATQQITREMIVNNMPEDKRKEFDALTDFQQEAIVAAVNFDRNLTPEQKQDVVNNSGVTQDAMPETSELWKDPRLEKYFPGAVGIAKPKEKKELLGTGISFSSRGGMNITTAPQVTNQDVLDAWKGAGGKIGNKEKLEQALDVMDDAKMRKLFDEYKNIFALRAAAQEEGEEFFVGEEQITRRQFDAIVSLSTLPIWSERDYTPMVNQTEAPAAAPAPAAGGERFPVKQGAVPAPTPTATPAAPARELTLAEQITATAPAPAPAAPTAPRKQPERRGATAARESTRLNREREELRKALYEVTRRGEVRGLKKGLDPENATVKRGIERLKEIEKQLASL
jgi:hypothetical protein